jgi:hypothetical protein
MKPRSQGQDQRGRTCQGGLDQVHPDGGQDHGGCHDQIGLDHTVKKGSRFSRPQPGCHLPNPTWPGII